MMVMQSLIVAVLLIALQVSAIPEEEHPHGHMILPFIKKCAESSGYKIPEMGQDRHVTPPEITDEFLCFLKCMGEEEGLLSSTGEVNPDKVDEFQIPMSAEKKEGLKKCLTKVVKVEKCTDLADMAECLKELHNS